jgi:hypothetical protein
MRSGAHWCGWHPLGAGRRRPVGLSGRFGCGAFACLEAIKSDPADHGPSLELVAPVRAAGAPGRGVRKPQQRLGAVGRLMAVGDAGPVEPSAEELAVSAALCVVDVVEDQAVDAPAEQLGC